MSGPTYSLSGAYGNNPGNRGTITFQIDRQSLRTYLNALNNADKEIQNEVREKSQDLAKDLARKLDQSANDPMIPPQAKLVAKSISTPKDRLPTVKIGGSKKVGRPYGGQARVLKSGRLSAKKTGVQRASAGALLYGSEYGSTDRQYDRTGRKLGPRFVKGRNPGGYWINPTVEAYGPDAFRAWTKIVDEVLTREGLN